MFTKKCFMPATGIALLGALLVVGSGWSRQGFAAAQAKKSEKSLDKGRALFARNCASCHGQDGGRGCMMAPSLVGVTERMSDREIVSHARSLAKRMCCARHLAFLSDVQYADIVGYLHTLKAGAKETKGKLAVRRGCGCGGR